MASPPMNTASTPTSPPPKPTEFTDKVRELTIAPFWTGVVQGFISVAMRRYKEKRALRRAAIAAKEEEDDSVRVSGGAGVGGVASGVAFLGGDGEVGNGD